MIRIRSLLAVSILCLLPGTASAGAPVYTPPLPFYYGVDSFRCLITNTGSKEAVATTEILRTNLGYAGTVLATTTETIAAGQLSGVILSDLTGGPWVICKVTGLSRKAVTVTFQALDSSGNVLTTVTAP